MLNSAHQRYCDPDMSLDRGLAGDEQGIPTVVFSRHGGDLSHSE
jgi:hypothetical protein